MSFISFVTTLFSSLSSNTLFSCIFTLYLIIFLYIPHSFFHLFPSPVLISTFILLLTLLRLGVSQQIQLHNSPNSNQTQSASDPDPEPKPEPIVEIKEQTDPHCFLVQTLSQTECDPELKPEPEPKTLQKIEYGPKPEPESKLKPVNFDLNVEKHESDQRKEESIKQRKYEPGPNPNLFSNRVISMEWDMGGPLEVIYEACEDGEEEKDEENNGYKQGNCIGKTEYPSLSRCYPESGSDSESDSGSDSSGSMWSREITNIEEWVEDEREGLIEIALDYNINTDNGNNKGGKEGINKKLMEVINFDDEDNLIEIDISPRGIFY